VAEYFFVKKGLDDRISEEWLNVSPSHKLLMPGESVEVELQCLFDASCAARFNLIDGLCLFEDNLLIHVDNGKDHFVRVHGNYLKSCYGNSLENLVTCFKCVRDLHCKQPPHITAADLEEDEEYTVSSVTTLKSLYIPKELFFMCDYIVKYGMREDGLFQVQGTIDQVRECREFLDMGQSLSKHFSGSIHSVCTCLIQFFESLHQPLIPGKLYRVLLDNYLDGDMCRDLINRKLSATHYNVWHYMMNFLREVLMNADANGLTPDSLSQGFAAVLVRSPKNMPKEMAKKHLKGKMQVIKHFLTKEYNQSMVAIEEDYLLFRSSYNTTSGVICLQ